MAFKIKDKGGDQLIVETDYYNWLQQNKVTNVHFINTKIQYLSEQGFVKGKDFLSEEDLYILKHIEQHYSHKTVNII